MTNSVATRAVNYFNIDFAISGYQNFLFENGSGLGSISPSRFPGLPSSQPAEDQVSWYADGIFPEDSSEGVFVTGFGLGLVAPKTVGGTEINNILLLEDGDTSLTMVAFLDCSIAPQNFMAAAQSATTTDDQSLLRTILAGDDDLTGSAFDDYIFGHTGNDAIFGGTGNDSILGELGNDTISGGGGNDIISAGAGNDVIRGSNGNDSLSASTGNDVLEGGAGRDTLDGGIDSARDIFRFQSVTESRDNANRDTIRNFTHLTDDINLQLIDANGVIAGDQAFAWAGSTAAAHSVWVVNTGTAWRVLADVTGDTTADFSVDVFASAALTKADFIL